MKSKIQERRITFDVFVMPMDSEQRIGAKLTVNNEEGNLTLKFNDFEIKTKNDEYWFGQIRNLDKKLNEKGYRLLCNGTSLGVNCYGFCSNMGSGFKAYRYDSRTVLVYEYSPWNRYATEEEQSEFLKFINEKYENLTKKMRDAKLRDNKSNEELLKMQDEWLRKRGIELRNFWKKELWK